MHQLSRAPATVSALDPHLKDEVCRALDQHQSALSIVDYNNSKGILRHVGLRGISIVKKTDLARLDRFCLKYLGERSSWNPWFIENIVTPLKFP